MLLINDWLQSLVFAELTINDHLVIAVHTEDRL